MSVFPGETMIRSTIALAALLAMSALAFCEGLLSPVPEVSPRDSLVRLSVEKGDSVVWVIRRLPDGLRPDIERIDNGRRCIWAGPPGRYDIDVIVSIDGTLIQDFARTTVGEPGPDPDPDPDPDPPGPGPDPDPDPDPDSCVDIPEDDFGNIGRVACQSLAGLSADALRRKPEIRKAYLDTVEAMDNPGDSGAITLADSVDYLRQRLSPIVTASPEWRAWGEKVDQHAASFLSNRLAYKRLCAAIAAGLQ